MNYSSNKEKKVAIKKLKNSKTFIDYAQTIDDIYESLENYIIQQRKQSVKSV